MNDKVFIGLGSNLGDCSYNLKQAIELIGSHVNVEITTSSVYRSEPVEVLDQPWFLNQVICFPIDNGLSPLELLQILTGIEFQMGRLPGIRYGPRLIDLDLLFYKNWVFECGELTIPHPKISERSFVLMPLAELDPTLVHPRLGKSIEQIILDNATTLSYCEKEAGS
jgi:2-amino-4-hydroxy-6-hydroxymethyldihydropteridine diphosphokinase